jgi:hypothetical protein
MYAPGPSLSLGRPVQRVVNVLLVVLGQRVPAVLLRWWCRPGGGCGGRRLVQITLRRRCRA